VKKYRLLKDLPGAKAGDVIYGSEGMFFHPSQFPDWCEPIEERWKPKVGEEYWTIADTVPLVREQGAVVCKWYARQWNWSNDLIDKGNYSSHLVFQTKEQAEGLLARLNKVVEDYLGELKEQK